MKNELAEQLLQQLIDGRITGPEFKHLAFQPSGETSPEVMKRAFPVHVTTDWRDMNTGEPITEWLPRLKKRWDNIRVVPMGITWEEWQAYLMEDDEDYFEALQASAEEMGTDIAGLYRWMDEQEMKKSILY